MKALDEAIAVWESARSAYEDAQRCEQGDGELLAGLRLALHEAQVALDAVVAELTERLRGETTSLLSSLQAGIAAKLRIQEHHALEAERTARHGELAGAGYTEREAVEQLEGAAQTLLDAATSLREALEILDGL